MDEQYMLDGFYSELQEDCISKFENSQLDNESEEDIHNVERLSFSDLAVTGTDWTVETIISQIKKGNIHHLEN